MMQNQRVESVRCDTPTPKDRTITIEAKLSNLIDPRGYGFVLRRVLYSPRKSGVSRENQYFGLIMRRSTVAPARSQRVRQWVMIVEETFSSADAGAGATAFASDLSGSGSLSRESSNT